MKIHTKVAIFWLVFSAKNPVKYDKLALIEGKILNLMFFDINISAVPIEIIWSRVTHNQRQKTLKVAFVLLVNVVSGKKKYSDIDCKASNNFNNERTTVHLALSTHSYQEKQK